VRGAGADAGDQKPGHALLGPLQWKHEGLLNMVGPGFGADVQSRCRKVLHVLRYLAFE
jgi:hypothetical protein